MQKPSNSETSRSSGWQDGGGTVSAVAMPTPPSGFQATELYKAITTTVMSQIPG
jgi:hypothetical protein